MEEWTISLQERVLKRFHLQEGVRFTIGRGADADVVIDNTAVSRLHTAVELRDGILFLEDLKSLNGTWVNGRKIDAREPVSRRDQIGIGKFRLAPATGGEQKEPVSFGTSMDLDDETVYVTPRSTPAAPPPKQKDSPEKAKHKLTVFQGKATPAILPLDNKSSVRIGREPSCELVIPGWLVAGTQCYLMRRDERYFIAPQWSLAGTWLNGLRIREERPLRSGDIIQIRRVKMRFD